MFHCVVGIAKAQFQLKPKKAGCHVVYVWLLSSMMIASYKTTKKETLLQCHFLEDVLFKLYNPKQYFPKDTTANCYS